MSNNNTFCIILKNTISYIYKRLTAYGPYTNFTVFNHATVSHIYSPIDNYYSFPHFTTSKYMNTIQRKCSIRINTDFCIFKHF